MARARREVGNPGLNKTAGHDCQNAVSWFEASPGIGPQAPGSRPVGERRLGLSLSASASNRQPTIRHRDRSSRRVGMAARSPGKAGSRHTSRHTTGTPAGTPVGASTC
jgi:hypothetical protein